MKRLMLSLLALCAVALLPAQKRHPFFVYTNGELYDIYYTSDVRKISFSPSTEEGADPNLIVNQNIQAGRYVNRLPLTAIDSISFVHPAPLSMKKAGRLNPITQEAFRALVWDYRATPNQQVFRGDKPAIIDYWAPWCKYCKEMMPVMEQLAQEYKGKIDFYKMDTDEETELSDALGITSLPCLYFYPRKGQPAVRFGEMSLSAIREIIENVLLITDDEDAEAEKPALSVECWKGDLNHEWTDRKATAVIRCTTQNASLVKYGCFRWSDFRNSGLSEREFIQQNGEVLAENRLAEVNRPEGLSLVFPVHRAEEYIFLCLVKNAQGGVTVEKGLLTTDDKFVPAIELQLRSGATIDQIKDRTQYVSLFIHTLDAATARYAGVKKEVYDAAIAAGETNQSLLKKYGTTLTPEEVSTANGIGFTAVIGGLEEMTDYVILADMRSTSGKNSTAKEDIRTAFYGYDNTIPTPEIGLVVYPIANGFSCSFSCNSGDAVHAAFLMLPAAEVTALLAKGQSLEDIIRTHPATGLIQDKQLEWVNGQGISNVYNSVKPDTRYTCLAEVKGRFGGRVVKRADVKTWPLGVTAAPIDVVLSSSCTDGMLSASAVCRSMNATAASTLLMESAKLEALLAQGKTLEDLPTLESADILTRNVFTEEQVGWFNQGGFVLGYAGAKPDTRYTWVIDARNAKGERLVDRVEILTPKKAL